MIDIRKLKELVKLMVENDLAELDLRDKEETVTIKRGAGEAPLVHHAMAPAMTNAIAPPASAEAAAGNGEAAADADEGLIAVESPMVGTFYSAPEPDADPFVTVGATVDADTTVCLIEAMKVFNPIKAQQPGTVARVLVKNGDAVEFGQKLFLIKPA